MTLGITPKAPPQRPPGPPKEHKSEEGGLYEPLKDHKEGMTAIAQLRPMARNLQCQVIILQLIEKRLINYGKSAVYCFKVADETGSVILEVFDHTGALFMPGDIVGISGGEAKLYQQQLRLSPSKDYGSIQRISSDVMHFSEFPDMSRITFIARPDPPRHG
ncbi:MAG: hypothetical protein DHS80DRAFT_31454 [Piptocephalis tieghemiana]|nr:MAG: hypothetical protein DHS80DRAFT_31454 [Piptocephalis tieghemiana]